MKPPLPPDLVRVSGRCPSSADVPVSSKLLENDKIDIERGIAIKQLQGLPVQGEQVESR